MRVPWGGGGGVVGCDRPPFWCKCTFFIEEKKIDLIRLLFRIQKYIHKLFLYHNEEYRNGIDIADLITHYSSDLPNADITDQELRLWQRKWSEYSPEFRPTTLEKTIKECNEDRFPNWFVLIKIWCTLPVTSCECERSFSAMRRLRTWLRVSMKIERLSSLALMSIHRNVEVNYDKVATLFFEFEVETKMFSYLSTFSSFYLFLFFPLRNITARRLFPPM